MNPIRKYPRFSIWFLGVIIVEVLALTVIPEYRIVSKVMIVASLIGLYIGQAKKQNELFLLALIFALLGDAFLLFTTETFFLIGLGCFLVMQLCYASIFYKRGRIPRSRDKAVVGGIALIPIIFLSLSWNMLADLQLPVFLYSSAITAMLILAYLRHPALGGYVLVLLGSCIFVVSDILLAVDKFVTAVPGGSIPVMLTYAAAQYLIVIGILADDEPKPAAKKVKKESAFGRHKL